MLDRQNCGLVFVDVQGELAQMVYKSAHLLANLKFLLRSCEALSIPIIWLEQYPQGLGSTVPELASILAQYDKASGVLEKTHFNAMLEPSIQQQVNAANCDQWLVVGIESHICVYQTVMGLLRENYSIHLLCDAISSLRNEDKQLAIKRLQQEGAVISSVEMAVFELLKDAKYEAFKPVLSLIKERQLTLNALN